MGDEYFDRREANLRAKAVDMVRVYRKAIERTAAALTAHQTLKAEAVERLVLLQA